MHSLIHTEYFLEDAIEMLHFLPPPQDRKKKRKEEDIPEDEDVCM